ncbi:uncharacterized protein LOC119111460 [Pollicipes pollicipes]|uniref:uncharacterized protein LOC119111460 n=1 Tax=Pollicipes pollicipes TaxID=41117 RepID=UPI001884E3C9|nr:uncharacterized protein LOC119111460 [Pollicipes pollicipes]
MSAPSMASLAVLGGLMSAGPGSPPPPDDDEEGDQASRGYPDSSASRSEDGYLDGSGSEKRLSCETLLSGAKKRRKQSHPVKIGPGGEAEPEVPPPGEAELPPPLRCPYCPQAFPHQVQFKYHIEVEHVRRALADDAPAESVIFGRELPLNLSSGPRHDGLRGQESKHQAENYRSEHSLPPAMPLPPSFQDKFPRSRVPAAGAAPPTPTPGESPLKIFNPEAYCELCNKEFCNKYFLKTHKANKHEAGAAGQGAADPYDAQQLLEPVVSPTLLQQLNTGETHDHQKVIHELMERLATNGESPKNFTKEQLREIGVVNVDAIRLEVEGQKKLERPKPASTSRSYCEICNKELCNKYFMKTHMIKMHGINMENHQIQGGVKCDVCQKELCSKYFLKVHKQNTHGIYDPEDDKALKASDAVIKDEEGLEVCTVCSGKFKTAKLLESHMASEHGAPKEKKPKSSSVPRSAPGIGVTCSLCGRCFPDLLSLRLHAMQAHPLPEQKGENNGTAGEETPLEPAQLGEKLLRHPFGPFAGPFPPFLPPEELREKTELRLTLLPA